ncbi:hypothetical protein, partial [Burkholderia sp. Cy-647]|uniref:hypothetical protein n=1 Tax=Burkholderia sp. Cy-647 TaxID=2608328 RepID=UPI0019633E9D
HAAWQRLTRPPAATPRYVADAPSGPKPPARIRLPGAPPLHGRHAAMATHHHNIDEGISWYSAASCSWACSCR